MMTNFKLTKYKQTSSYSPYRKQSAKIIAIILVLITKLYDLRERPTARHWTTHALNGTTLCQRQFQNNLLL